MSCLVAVWAAFERFVFGSRHDFLISDLSPFSQSRPLNQYFYLPRWRRVTLLFFSCYSWILGFIYDLGMGVARDSHRKCIY